MKRQILAIIRQGGMPSCYAPLLLVLALAVALPARASDVTIDLSNPGTGGTGWTLDSGDAIWIQDPTIAYIITGDAGGLYRVYVGPASPASTDPFNITLDNATINTTISPSIGNSAFAIEPGCTVNLTLVGTNSLTSAINNAGLQVPDGAALTITSVSTGNLIATGGMKGAGIGGGSGTSGGNITINGGSVTANGGDYGAGVGGGQNGAGGTIAINGGNVNATGGSDSAGVGGGQSGDGGNVTINGGTVNAQGGAQAAGIGGGDGTSNGGSGGTIAINGGSVTAYGGNQGAGIGGGYNGDGGNITIKGDDVTATGGGNGAGIGGGRGGDGGVITIISGMVRATGGFRGAGIGGGIGASGGTIGISGGTVTATGGGDDTSPSYGGGAGIGGGGNIGGTFYGIDYNSGSSGDISITGNASVTATGGDGSTDPSGSGGGAGIGSGGVGNTNAYVGAVGTLAINTTGTVSATGGSGTVGSGDGANIGMGGSTNSAGTEYYTIAISTQPAVNTTVIQGSITGSLSVSVNLSPSSSITPTYMWYSNTANNNSGGVSTGITTPAFTIPTTLMASGSPYYYYCVVSAMGAAPVTSNVAALTVKETTQVTTDQATPSVALTATGGTYTNNSITLTATVGAGVQGQAYKPAPTGTITFMEGNTTLGTKTLNRNGTATFTIASLIDEGRYTFTAEYSGDDNYPDAVSDPCTVDVTAFLSVSSPSLHFDAQGGTQPLLLACNSVWSLDNNAPWLSIAVSDFKADNPNLILDVTAEANPEATERKALLTLSLPGVMIKAVSVTQDAGVNPATGMEATGAPSVIVYSQSGNAVVKSDAPIKSVAVYDVSGKLLKQGNGGNSLITISGLPKQQVLIVKVVLNANDAKDANIRKYKLIII